MDKREFKVSEWTQDVAGDPVLEMQIAHIRQSPATEGRFRSLKTPLHPDVEDRLAKLGITKFFSHQAAAYDLAREGADVVVSTGTNSGKSLCYNLPVLQGLCEEPSVRALYLFPTKALARDQAEKMEALKPYPGLRIGVYDGDTPPAQRSAIRKMAQIVVTNPDMLHVGILPQHENWSQFLRSLRYVVVDELHSYRGVFGSHVAGVLRRLLAQCEWRKARPQIFAASATIANASEAFTQLTGREAFEIDVSGASSGGRTIVFWNPPELPNGNRVGATATSSEILASMVQLGARTLVFSRSRQATEIVLRQTRARLDGAGLDPPVVDSYRAGYTPTERREIEKALFSGRLLGLSATNALELGVDVGALDVVIMNGYPGSISGFWQQAGRAGRGIRDGLVIFVANNDPFDQHLMRRPEELFSRQVESICLNPENEMILGKQLVCAAHERALSATDLVRYGPSGIEVAENLEAAGELAFGAGRFFFPGAEAPAPKVSIRGGGPDSVRLICDGETIGELEKWRALGTAHAGAVYLHRGALFQVRSLDLNARIADIVPFDGDYSTTPIIQTAITQKLEIRFREAKGYSVGLVAVTATEAVVGYDRKSLRNGATIDKLPLEMPPSTFDTLAVRIGGPEMIELDVDMEVGGLHGAEHALLAMAPMRAGCDRGDLGSAWYAAFHDDMRPAIFVFDREPGGVGLCERLFAEWNNWVGDALNLPLDCDCGTGCPGCLLSPSCEVSNENIDKRAAIRLLTALRASISI